MEFGFWIAVAWVVLNAAAFTMFAWDKWSAENRKSRIPEINLLFVALIGGSIGAIAGQQILRHKTWKEPFRTMLYSIVVIQIVAAVALSVPELRRAIFQTLGIR